MIWMLVSAPSCRSASSWCCRQVAVTPCNRLMEAEKEKFPSPTSNMDREGDMTSPAGNHKNSIQWEKKTKNKTKLPFLYSFWVRKGKEARRSDNDLLLSFSFSRSNINVIIAYFSKQRPYIVFKTVSAKKRERNIINCTAEWSLLTFSCSLQYVNNVFSPVAACVECCVADTVVR